MCWGGGAGRQRGGTRRGCVVGAGWWFRASALPRNSRRLAHDTDSHTTPHFTRAIFGPDPLRGYRVLRSLVAPSETEFTFPGSSTVGGVKGTGGAAGGGGVGRERGGAGGSVVPVGGRSSPSNLAVADDSDGSEDEEGYRPEARERDSVITYSEVISVFGTKPVTITVWGYLIASDAGVAGEGKGWEVWLSRQAVVKV